MDAKEETMGHYAVEDVTLDQTAVKEDHRLEHHLTVRSVFKNHPVLVWWTFYWAMAAVGWCVS